MKLHLSKRQATGMLGRVKFEIEARTELTSEEANLVKKYKAEHEVLLKRQINIPFTGNTLTINLTVGSLMAGHNFKCNDIGEMLEYEKNLKESCGVLKLYLEAMRDFGGQETIEYT